MLLINFREIEEKWQRRWEEARVFEVEPDESKPKIFITAAYPYLNGNLHGGHLRTFTIPDIYARFKRMQGYNVLWSFGFHVTGTPILGLAERIKNRDPDVIRVYTEHHGVPLEDLLELTTPEKVVEYFAKKAREAMVKMGYALDWRRNFKTDDPQYNRFIEWQFYKLREKGYIKKGTHPVRYCPRCDNPVEDHDLLYGEEATLVDFVLIKFRLDDGSVLPAATLRPETVFGVTNMFLNPDAIYVKARVNGEIWIVSKEAAEKLVHQAKRVEVLEEFKGEKLMGRFVENPVTGSKIPILPGFFVDPDSASGVVMSVPAHAPYDWVALEDLRKDPAILEKYGISREILEKIAPISIIRAEGFGEYPAKDAVESLGIRDQRDPRLEDATSLVYRREFHTGVMKENTGRYAGMRVSEAKERIRDDMIREGKADVMWEFSEKPVVCRCGTPCIVKIVEDQWFITYSDPEWKKLAHEALDEMMVIPEEYHKEFHNKIDWMKDKACARRRGLGTRLPWDPKWVIESLSDSTIYMAYYTIAKHINEHGLKAENLPYELFDYVFLGEGDPDEIARKAGISSELVRDMRREFLYWYPLDWRCSGKDLIPNHLTFFIFNHVAIFPRELWPKGIVVNGFVSVEGKKLSKSKGPVLPILQVVERYGADVARLYISSVADLMSDADFKHAEAETYRRHLMRFYETCSELMELASRANDGEPSVVDRWILSRLNKRVKRATDALERFDTRTAANEIFFELYKDVRRYLRRTGNGSSANKRVLEILVDSWIRLMAPFTPHICEELWSKLGREGFVSNARWPEFDPNRVDELAEISEELLDRLLEDVREVMELMPEKPRKLYIYVASREKREIAREIVRGLREGARGGELVRRVMESSERARRMGKAAVDMIGRMEDFLLKLDEEHVEFLERRIDDLDELEIFENASDFIAREMGLESVEVYSEDSSDIYDPKGRARRSLPLKPAIYLE